MKKKVTVVLTSCLRHDLLKETLKSFFKFNTYPIESFIIIEDSAEEKSLQSVVGDIQKKFQNIPFQLLTNGERKGQLYSIDRAYSLVKTDYIFHCEDDWCFFRSGFIEESIEHLEAEPLALSVWLRPLADYHGFKLQKQANGNSIACSQVLSFNPGLRRYADYLKIKSYSEYVSDKVKNKEILLSNFYEELGYYALILSQPAVSHEGWHRRLDGVEAIGALKGLKLLNSIKKLKAAYYKKFKKGHFKPR